MAASLPVNPDMLEMVTSDEIVVARGIPSAQSNLKAAFGRRLKAALKKRLPSELVLAIEKVRNVRWIKVHEPREFDVMRHLLDQGDTVIDIGANMGEYSRSFSVLVGSGGHVFSIEPVPHTYEILKYVVNKLGLVNTSPIECAISDVEGVRRMVIPQDESGGENFYEASLAEGTFEPTWRSVQVKTTTLDSLVSPWTKISFIKCDVEGHELNCVKGAFGIIRTSHPAWYIETKDNPDDPTSTSGKLFEAMNLEGYLPFLFDGTCLHKRRRGESTINYYFLMQSHIYKLHSRAPQLIAGDVFQDSANGYRGEQL